MVSLDQFKAGFLTECDELLVDMESMLVALTPDSADNETLNAIFRCAHSIKGGAGAFGLEYITHFTHILEALLDAMREGRILVSRETVDALLQSVDIVTTMVQCAKQDKQPPEGLGAELAARLQVLAGMQQQTTASPVPTTPPQPIPTEEAQEFLIYFKPKRSIFTSGNDPVLLLRDLRSLGETDITCHHQQLPPVTELDWQQCYLWWEIRLKTEKGIRDIQEVFEFVEDECELRIDTAPVNTTTKAVATPAISTQPAITTTPPAMREAQPLFNRRATDHNHSSTIRVDLDKVDKLVNIVGELVITEAMIKSQLRHLPQDRYAHLLRDVDALSHHTRELQEAVMSVRMQPVKSIFSRMPRMVRDLSAQLGKEIVLEMEGENTEVDKTVIEQLGDPLNHMIRNSVDHGIESPDKRIAAGKPSQGTIRLSAMHQSGRIIIEIRDDGAGINRERVLAKAKEKGLIAEDAILSDEACDNIIFMPGFSTAETVSDVSGRGVGMDVVRRNIEALNGTVHVNSEQGKGSVFTVSLPLTLAILDGMIVRVGAESYVIPITSIIETLRPKAQEVRHVEGACDVINVRGEFIPILYLHELFHIAHAEADASKALVVLVEAGKEKMGVVVDELIGQQQVVIKSLEVNTDPVQGISGATILGDGKVALILEIAQLKQLSAQHKRHLKPQAA